MPAILRIYVIEEELGSDPNLLDALRQETVRAVAAIRLLGSGFIEAPGTVEGLGSALLHQVLSVICERGGARAETIHRILCGPGPFAGVGTQLFLDLLRSMGSQESKLIEQASDGTLMLGATGERLSSSRDFYSLFASGQEWQVVTSGKSLGSLPVNNPVLPGNLMVFAGRRWVVRDVDEAAHVITVDPHRGGKVPLFGGSPEAVDDRLSAEMLSVLMENDEPGWVDATMRRLLAEGRREFRRLALDSRRALRAGNDVHLMTWRGTRSNGLLAILLGAEGFKCWAHDIGVVVFQPDVDGLARTLARLEAEGVPDLDAVAADVGALASGKFDGLIAPKVLQSFWALGIQGVAQDVRSTASQLRIDQAQNAGPEDHIAERTDGRGHDGVDEPDDLPSDLLEQREPQKLKQGREQTGLYGGSTYGNSMPYPVRRAPTSPGNSSVDEGDVHGER